MTYNKVMQYSLSKIIIALTVVVIVGGGIVMWWLFVAAPAQRSVTPTNQTNNNGGSDQTSVTSTSQPATTSGVLDFEKEYAALFQKLSAQGIVFDAVDQKSTGALAVIYGLYASEVAESKSLYPADTNFSIQVSLIDLDNDGTPEAVVYNNLDGYCGSGGCALDIYKVVKGKWVNIFSGLTGGDIGLSNASTKGYFDLFLSVHGDIGSQSSVIRYSWDGKTYQPKETVATWNGKTFILPQ